MCKGLRLVCLLLAVLLPFGAGAGPLSEALAPLTAYRAGQPYSITLSMDVAAWPDVADTTLDALREWLRSASLSLSAREKDGAAEGFAALRRGGAPVFTLGTGNGALLLEVPGVLPMTRYLLGGVAASALLPGETVPLPDPSGALAGARGAALALLPLLEPYGKAEKGGISIRNAGTAASRVEYVLRAQEAQGIWDAAKGEAVPLLSAMLGALGLTGQADALAGLSFAGKISIKRYLDAQGKDMGLQVTGVVLWNGAQRRMTLYGGVSSRGAYASVRFPAARGADTLEAQVSLTLTHSRAQCDWRLKYRESGEGLDASGKADVKAARQEDGVHVTGSLAGKIRRIGWGAARDWTLSPDLLISGDAVSGQAEVIQKESGKVRRQFTLRIAAAPVPWPAAQEPLAEVDAGAMDAAELGRLRAGLAAAMMTPIREYLQSLPLAQRLMILHDFGRLRRTQGDPVPAPGAPGETFTVSDFAEELP